MLFLNHGFDKYHKNLILRLFNMNQNIAIPFHLIDKLLITIWNFKVFIKWTSCVWKKNLQRSQIKVMRKKCFLKTNYCNSLQSLATLSYLMPNTKKKKWFDNTFFKFLQLYVAMLKFDNVLSLPVFACEHTSLN